jgi:NAD(P)-dependent dehydrogenase (short-subunit alcohol dehydrogenase family)
MVSHGGNWKDLLKAAGEGDLGKARYHLQQQGGADPNFQHPEYFTAPIFEAIRNNHLDMVQLLVETGKTNPALMEEMTDLTPIELALQEEKHAIVDYLNTQLPAQAQWKPKHVLVTGGNRGIGKAIVESLLRQGHAVAFTCRDAVDGEQVVTELIQVTGNTKIQVVVGDLSSISTTRVLAKTILTEFPGLQILIHNAGIWPTECQINDDGLELSFMVNYVAPLLLTEMLLPNMETNGPDIRVVLVTAGLAIFGKSDVTKTPFGTDFSRLKTYWHTKQCGLIWCMHQARLQLSKKDPTTRATFNAVHPGVINTGLGATEGCIGCILRVVKRAWKTPAEGAIAPVWLAVSPEAGDIHGKFYNEMKPRALEGDAACMLDRAVQDQWAQWTKDFLVRHDKDKQI